MFKDAVAVFDYKRDEMIERGSHSIIIGSADAVGTKAEGDFGLLAGQLPTATCCSLRPIAMQLWPHRPFDMAGLPRSGQFAF